MIILDTNVVSEPMKPNGKRRHSELLQKIREMTVCGLKRSHASLISCTMNHVF
jgi:predicted nucleic acid-binding protein